MIKKKNAAVIKAENSSEFENYSFFSFDEKRKLQQEIDSLKKEIQNLKNKNESIIAGSEKELVELEIKFQENIEIEKKNYYEKGLAEGRNQGINESKAKVLEVSSYLSQVAKETSQAKNKFLFQNEKSLLVFTKALVQKVINKKLNEDDQEIIIGTIAKGLKSISDKSEIRIKLSSENFELAEDFIADIKKIFNETEAISFEIDPQISKGSCLIETNNEIVDAQIETQIEEIFNLITSEYEQKMKNHE